MTNTKSSECIFTEDNCIQLYPDSVCLTFDDREHTFDEIKNYIITDRLITEHVLNCKECMNEGLNKCGNFQHLPGVFR